MADHKDPGPPETDKGALGFPVFQNNTMQYCCCICSHTTWGQRQVSTVAHSAPLREPSSQATDRLHCGLLSSRTALSAAVLRSRGQATVNAVDT